MGPTQRRLELEAVGGESPHGVVAEVPNGDILVSEFELQSHYYVNFQTYTTRKDMNLLLSPAHGLNSTTTILLQSWLRHLILFTNPSARAGYDTRSVFKRSLTGLISEFSFS